MTRALIVLAALALALAQGASARAYSDPAKFAEPALRGGGEGRFFTGSPADGYTCATCHRGGPTPGLFVYGMPESLEPGTTYPITLRWTQPEINHALQLELLTERGQTPLVNLTPEATATQLSRCESAPDGELASYAVDLPGRRVLGVRDCGASELSFTFVAPDAERVYLTASLVRSDSMGSFEGDGVLDLKRTLYRRGAEPEEGGCALAPSRGARGGGTFVALLGLALAWRSRRRRWSGAFVAALLLTGCYAADQSADYVPVDGGGVALDASAMDAASATPDASPGPSLHFRMRTLPFGGRYAPLHVVAVWVERAEGDFVKTLELRAATRTIYLRNWLRISAGDVTDAITSATLKTHQVHELRWDFTDAAGKLVPDGNYKLGLELTDRDATGALYYVPFVKGPGAQPVPVSSPQFVDLELSITP